MCAVLGLLLVAMLQTAVCSGDASYRSPTSGETVDVWDGTGGPAALHKEYGRIFPHGNRNAASHLWTTFLFERARFMPKKRFLTLAGSYCAVSGSPVDPGDGTRYRMRLPHVDGSGTVTGFMYFCCWPCICDSQDFIRVDTKTIRTAEGLHKMRVAVIGNPCDDSTALAQPWTDPFSKRTTTLLASAEEIRCRKSGKLVGATMSDHGYPIISLFFSAPSNFEDTQAYKRRHHFEDEREFASMCEDRKEQGYNSGTYIMLYSLCASRAGPVTPSRTVCWRHQVWGRSSGESLP